MLNAGDLSLLPPEVIDEIFSYCHTSDFLQLRLVSRSIKTFVNSSSKFEDALTNFKIVLDSSTLEAFVKTAPPFPYSNFQIITDEQECFYKDTSYFRIFKRSFCPRIRTLCLDFMSCCTWPDELEFFLCLRKLTDLSITKLIPAYQKHVMNSEAMEYLQCTGTNRSLKRLSVEYEKNSWEYLNDLIRSCTSLEFLKIPRPLEGPAGAAGDANDDCIPYILGSGAIGHLQHLQTIDFNYKTIPMDLCDERNLQFFEKIVANKKFRLMNVVPEFAVRVREAVGLETFEHFKQRIASFKGILKLDDLRNLEELSIEFNDWVSSEWTTYSQLNNLPALKRITVEISDAMKHTRISWCSIVSLFKNRLNPKKSVSQLRINYKRSDRPTSLHLRIKPEYLRESFPNLTHLYVQSDRFSTGELGRLVGAISRKRLLEELVLCTSAGIPGRHFADLLGLKRLRKFALKTNLDCHVQDERREECQKMDDRMLEGLSKMSLTHLYITGLVWDEVTCGGIEGLTKGAFGKSVLRVRLACVGSTPRPKSQQGEYSKVLEGLERVAHGNRAAEGLTSTSFREYKAPLGNVYPLVNCDSWIDELIKW